MLTNGPGDPEPLADEVAVLRELLGRVPVARAVPALVGCLVGGLVIADVASLAALVRFYALPGFSS
jgi:carbamoylphosphate synthase small subunit